MISFIVAMDENRLIGRNNQLPWHLPEDLKFFKRMTLGHPVAMGRKTHESIGRTLPGRENLIITRQFGYQSEGCKIFYSIDDFIHYCREQNEEIFVIGGAEIFRETLKYAERLYITLIHHQFEGDTYFPAFNLADWKLVSSEKGLKDEKNPYDYEFRIYEKNAKVLVS
ncbi:dihydrofolate reductase [Neobacillus sp. OS1-32]|jgi:dihydrofolate reductase|uniref:Dihydrofolate reductase n=1 Tax=Neobacillus paridis TaxID=2803862 RepID=A0ABS1TR98_9BACI|nr:MULTISPECIES: dihydrofolate reductase [Neobacillus]MBL4953841.1 dihydrofolate reductase [Neobacillus paridis]WML30957.1 dihydrofolate reductase [Neobacillus sp. OS1-32]